MIEENGKEEEEMERQKAKPESKKIKTQMTRAQKKQRAK